MAGVGRIIYSSPIGPTKSGKPMPADSLIGSDMPGLPPLSLTGGAAGATRSDGGKIGVTLGGDIITGGSSGGNIPKLYYVGAAFLLIAVVRHFYKKSKT